MKRLLCSGALLVMTFSLTSCSSLNPFASESKIKPAELTTFTPTAELRTSWQVSVGSSDEYVLTPAVVSNSVYAAAADGTQTRFDNGIVVWRVSAGQVVSGGVGSD